VTWITHWNLNGHIRELIKITYLTNYIDWPRTVMSSLLVQVGSVVQQRLAAELLSTSQCLDMTKSKTIF